MNAQDLLNDAARSDVLPQDLWDMVRVPAEPSVEDRAVPRSPLSPDLEVVDVHELPPITDEEDVRWRLRRLVRTATTGIVVAFLASIALLITSRAVPDLSWYGTVLLGAVIGALVLTAAIEHIT